MTQRNRMLAKVRDYVRMLLLFAVLAVTITYLTKTAAVYFNGHARIIDGDSIVVDGQEIRLEGIDAPEFDQTCKTTAGIAKCGRLSAAHLRKLIGGKSVSCEGWQEDQYDRLLAKCVSQGRELNQIMVHDGWAVSFGEYQGEEAKAHSAKRGLWAGEFERPSSWRRTKRENGGNFEWFKAMMGN